MVETENGINWDVLLRRIKNGKCTPFLGAGACFPHIPLASKIAKEWAKEYGYPLKNSHDLAMVSQFLAVNKRDGMWPKEVLIEKFQDIPYPDFNNSDDPHGFLASLPLPVYITTNYDGFMFQALKNSSTLKKDPKVEICKWNQAPEVEAIPSVFENGSHFEPSMDQPVVFHLHGHYRVPESLVLTEDDYLDFLKNMSSDNNRKVIPARIQRALAGTTILFLGYSLNDWNLRVILRSVIGFLNNNLSRSHVSVQLVPDEGMKTEDQKREVKKYLTKYFGNLEIQVHWGTCQEFVKELRRQWEAKSN